MRIKANQCVAFVHFLAATPYAPQRPSLKCDENWKIYFGNFRCLLPTMKYVNFNYAQRQGDRPRPPPTAQTYNAAGNWNVTSANCERAQHFRAPLSSTPTPPLHPAVRNLLRQIDSSTNVSILCKNCESASITVLITVNGSRLELRPCSECFGF